MVDGGRNEVVVFNEFRVEGGYGYVSEKYIDLLVLYCHASKRYERAAYEVKVSRRDFNRELRKPLKRWVGMLFTNRFYFAAPEGLIKRSEVPDDCGLVEVDESGAAKVSIKAPWRESRQPTWPFVVSLARRVVDVEGE